VLRWKTIITIGKQAMHRRRDNYIQYYENKQKLPETGRYAADLTPTENTNIESEQVPYPPGADVN
jgi:hypothetical protein